MSKLLDFLTDLAIDPQKQQAFARFSEAFMDAAGLSEADKTALKSGDKAKVAAPFAEEFPDLACGAFDPVPDPLPDPDPLPPPPPPPDSVPQKESRRAIAP